jgi:hypothetical protein
LVEILVFLEEVEDSDYNKMNEKPNCKAFLMREKPRTIDHLNPGEFSQLKWIKSHSKLEDVLKSKELDLKKEQAK